MPAYKKNHRAYPLKTFETFLASRVTASTRPHYIAAIRKMLMSVMPPFGPGWQHFEAVLAHYQLLNRQQQNDLQAAWNHFLDFGGKANEMPRLSLGRTVDEGPLHAAMRVLLSAFDPEMKPRVRYTRSDVVEFVWRRTPETNRWVVRESRDLEAAQVWIEPKWQPALRVVREWGYPGTKGGDACRDGVFFLPGRPHADFHMERVKLDRLLARVLDRHGRAFATKLDEEMRRATHF